MLCNQDAACRFGLGVTRKSEQPPTVPKCNNDVPSAAFHVGDFGPGDADIHGAAEFQPAAGQDHMTVLIGAATAKTNRCHEMAFVPGRKWIGSLDPRQLSAPKAGGEFGRGGIIEKK